MVKIAIILLRSLCGMGKDVKDTLGMLHLSRRQHCSVFEDSSSLYGMLDKIKDYVTYGEISEDTYRLLCEKKGEKDPKDSSKLKNLYRLNSPKGGYERKGIKVTFVAGGALGKRTDMDKLIGKMI